MTTTIPTTDQWPHTDHAPDMVHCVRDGSEWAVMVDEQIVATCSDLAAASIISELIAEYENDLDENPPGPEDDGSRSKRIRYMTGSSRSTVTSDRSPSSALSKRCSTPDRPIAMSDLSPETP